MKIRDIGAFGLGVIYTNLWWVTLTIKNEAVTVVSAILVAAATILLLLVTLQFFMDNWDK